MSYLFKTDAMGNTRTFRSFPGELHPGVPEYNVLIGNVSEQDKLALFNPGPEDVFTYSKAHRFDQLLRDLGVFKSISEARGAGYAGDIPFGWSEFEIKRRLGYVTRIHWVCVYKQ